jgi:hypothetical protein
MEITVSKEESRGCGYRHSGVDGVGLYLMGTGIFEICERLPFPLGVCPVCGEGTKFSRGFTWITPVKLFGALRPPVCDMTRGLVPEPGPGHAHIFCNLCSPLEGKHGLLWVGEKFYSVGSFMQEAVTRGISKRIATLPHGFEVGKTVVYLAHQKAIKDIPYYGNENDTGYIPGVFTVFRPSCLDIVVDSADPNDLPERAVNIAKKLGDKCRLVKVEPVYEQENLFPEEE